MVYFWTNFPVSQSVAMPKFSAARLLFVSLLSVLNVSLSLSILLPLFSHLLPLCVFMLFIGLSVSLEHWEERSACSTLLLL